MTDHNELVTMVPEQGGTSRVIEACKRCLGYVKSFTTLQGSPAAKVMLDDLASVDLDWRPTTAIGARHRLRAHVRSSINP
jgi:formate dehydrogenase maturation protein FdhE